MRIILGLIRAVLILGGFIALAVVVGVVMLVGGAYMLLTGRRPKVRVFRPQGFGGPFERPPMKDVTPISTGTLPGQT